MPVNQVLAVQESQGIHGGQQQFPGFFPDQGTTQKKIGEILVGMLHDHVQVLILCELAPTGVQETEQVRMGETGSRVPMCELPLGECWQGGNQFQRGFGRIACRIRSEEYTAAIRVTDAGLQWEESIDNLTRPLRPDFGCWQSFLHTRSHPTIFRVSEDITECCPRDGGRIHNGLIVPFHMYANA